MTGTSEPSARPIRVAVSVGDPHGIGPEVLLKALSTVGSGQFEVHAFAAESYLRSLAEDLSLKLDWSGVRIHETGSYPYPPRWGAESVAAGKYALRSLGQAVDFCRSGNARLLVTAPIHKESAHRAGFGYPGQTEFIASRCNVPDPTMAFFSKRLNVALATIHVPLRSVPRLLSRELLVSKALTFHTALLKLGLSAPRIAVCGLNPHASEGGLFGDEEAGIIKPAVEEISARIGVGSVLGPISPDTVFLRGLKGQFEGILALYHDQGLIPLKLTAFESAVNATLGIPFVRTSPDHGTAFDLAGRGEADPGSMIAAFEVGVQLGGL